MGIHMKYIVVVLILAGAIGGGYFFLKQTKNSPQPILSQPKADSSMPVPGTKTVEKIVTQEDRYIPYSLAQLTTMSNKKRVLYFYANWCPICRPIDEEFRQKMSQIPENVVVIRVNYNDSDTDAEEKDLAKKYGITYQHTFVQIDAQGNKIAIWNGGGLTELLANIK